MTIHIRLPLVAALCVALAACATGNGTSSTSTGGTALDASAMPSGSMSASTSATSMSDRYAGTQLATGASMAAGAGATANLPVAHSQVEALALVAAVDDHEIRTSQQAKSKKVTAAALDYANMMVAHHSANLAATRKLMGGASAMNSASVKQLVAMARQAEAQLATLSGTAYERAYVDRMVLDHQMALQMLDASMGVARDAAARAHLTATRQAVQQHLDRARTLQGGTRS